MPKKALGVLSNLSKWAIPNTKKTRNSKRAKGLPTTLEGKENNRGVNKKLLTPIFVTYDMDRAVRRPKDVKNACQTRQLWMHNPRSQTCMMRLECVLIWTNNGSIHLNLPSLCQWATFSCTDNLMKDLEEAKSS